MSKFSKAMREVQTNRTKEITVGASPTNKKKENRVSDSLRGPSRA